MHHIGLQVQIDQSLRRAAERYDKELDKDLQRIMALIMPTVLIIMAGSGPSENGVES